MTTPPVPVLAPVTDPVVANPTPDQPGATTTQVPGSFDPHGALPTTPGGVAAVSASATTGVDVPLNPAVTLGSVTAAPTVAPADNPTTPFPATLPPVGPPPAAPVSPTVPGDALPVSPGPDYPTASPASPTDAATHPVVSRLQKTVDELGSLVEAVVPLVVPSSGATVTHLVDQVEAFVTRLTGMAEALRPLVASVKGFEPFTEGSKPDRILDSVEEAAAKGVAVFRG